MVALESDLHLSLRAQLAQRSHRAVPPLVAAAVALAAGGVLVVAAGSSPVTAYRTMIDGSFGNLFDLGQVLVQAIPLIIIGLGLAIAFRGGVYNIGAEGQLFVGALTGGAVAIAVPWHSAWLIPVEVLAGIAGGAAWGSIVGVLRGRWGVNEVISSLLLNYVGIYLFDYMIRRPLADPATSSDLTSRPVPGPEMLPSLPRLFVHYGLFVALALVPVVGYVMRRTPFGFRVRMMGLNREAATLGGVNTARYALWLMIISGGFAGLAGIIQVLGVEGQLDAGISNNYGYTAIVVALLGRLTEVGVLLSALFIAFLVVGGQAISVNLQLPYSLVLAIQGVFILSILVVGRFARTR